MLDDGSTDDTEVAAREAAGGDPRCRVDPRPGQSRQGRPAERRPAGGAPRPTSRSSTPTRTSIPRRSSFMVARMHPHPASSRPWPARRTSPTAAAPAPGDAGAGDGVDHRPDPPHPVPDRVGSASSPACSACSAATACWPWAATTRGWPPRTSTSPGSCCWRAGTQTTSRTHWLACRCPRRCGHCGRSARAGRAARARCCTPTSARRSAGDNHRMWLVIGESLASLLWVVGAGAGAHRDAHRSRRSDGPRALRLRARLGDRDRGRGDRPAGFRHQSRSAPTTGPSLGRSSLARCTRPLYWLINAAAALAQRDRCPAVRDRGPSASCGTSREQIEVDPGLTRGNRRRTSGSRAQAGAGPARVGARGGSGAGASPPSAWSS